MKYILPILSFVLQTWAHNHFGPVVFSPNGPIQPYNIPRRTYNHLYHAQRPDSVHVVNYHQGCPDVLQPICATNGKVFLHFRNKCFLSNYNYQALIRGHRGMVFDIFFKKNLVLDNFWFSFPQNI